MAAENTQPEWRCAPAEFLRAELNFGAVAAAFGLELVYLAPTAAIYLALRLCRRSFSRQSE